MNFLMAYYAMGWVTCGVEYALLPSDLRAPKPIMFLAWPMIFVAIIAIALGFWLDKRPKKQPAQQYLWRKP